MKIFQKYLIYYIVCLVVLEIALVFAIIQMGELLFLKKRYVVHIINMVIHALINAQVGIKVMEIKNVFGFLARIFIIMSKLCV